MSLRAWQQAALDDYLGRGPRDYLMVATPGGKTAFVLRVAAELLERRVVHRPTVVAPTEHLKRQWAEAAERVGTSLDPAFSLRRGRTSRDFSGVVVHVRRGGVAPDAAPGPLGEPPDARRPRRGAPRGDSLSWGGAVREAFDRPRGGSR